MLQRKQRLFDGRVTRSQRRLLLLALILHDHKGWIGGLLVQELLGIGLGGVLGHSLLGNNRGAIVLRALLGSPDILLGALQFYLLEEGAAGR